jgi:hypothetical protein
VLRALSRSHKEEIALSGCAKGQALLPEVRGCLCKGEFETRPYANPPGMCRGANPLCQGLACLQGLDESSPYLLGIRAMGSNQAHAMVMQQNAAGARGVPEIFFSPQSASGGRLRRSGGQGVEGRPAGLWPTQVSSGTMMN